MRICLHTIREISPGFVGGTERLLVDLAKEIQLLGYDAFIACSGMKRNLAVEGVPVFQNVPQEYVTIYRKHGVANSAFLRDCIPNAAMDQFGLLTLGAYVDAQLSQTEADIFHLNSFAMSMFSQATHRAVVSNHENDLEFDRTWGTGATQSYCEAARNSRSTLSKASHLNTASKHYAAFFSEKLNLPVSDVKLGVRLSSFPLEHRAQRTPGPLRILLPSRFDPDQKGHDLAIRAAAILKEQRVDFQMVFSGVRADYVNRIDSYRMLAKKYGVLSHLVFKRFECMNSAYQDCDMVISPERYCSYGLSVSEALSLGIPTIMSDIPTYKEIASVTEHAVFFERENVSDLAEKIMVASKATRTGRSDGATKFRVLNDLRKTAIEFHEIYQSINRSRTVV